jgi:hypothetical protein
MPRSVQIHIPRPCHENWENMTHQEKGRFCGACQITVVDFSKMTDKEMLDHISNAGHTMCGRFSDNQLNREIPVQNNKRRFSWAYVWNLLLATVLFTESCTQEEVTGKIAVEDIPSATILQQELKGYVLDSQSGTPVVGASVRIPNGKGVLTDSTGRFSLLIVKNDSIVLEVKAPWYVTRPVLIDNKVNWQNLIVLMTGESFRMGAVMINEENKNK